MSVSFRDSVEVVSSPCHLDAAVEEVFHLMLGVHCRRRPVHLNPDLESVTAVVGFAGVLSGACLFRCGGPTARQIAACMTGMDFPEVDDTVKDAVGEVCNMLAGAWKGAFPELSAGCGLSVPAVITGRDYRLRVQAPEFRLSLGYGFDDACFEITLVCDGIR